jgi:(p)ppGpp synthase/HD superfamily hydrolase
MKQHWSIDEVQNIWQLASRLHDGQKYGGSNEGEKIEYINHIGSVTFEVINAIHYTEDIDAGLAIKCAILHDTIEDTSFTYTKVKELFGDEVANGVMALSKNDKIEDHLEKMLDSLKRIKQQPKEIWAVKLADRIVNLYEPPYYWNNDKKKKYKEEAEIILKELGDGNKYLADRLRSKIASYDRFITGS